jgi:predicted CXXCH cytochrome family protein
VNFNITNKKCMTVIGRNLSILICAGFICLLCYSPVKSQMLSSKRECAICHIAWMDDFKMEGKKIFVDPIIRGEVIIAGRQGVVSTQEICYTCHDGAVLDSRDMAWMPGSHPVFVKPSKNVTIPKTFPLDKKGRIFCGTCHSAHGVDWGKKPDEVILDRTIFLRHENPNSFICRQCHTNKLPGENNNNHPVNVTSLKIPEKIYKMGGKTGMAPDQVICESCHRVHGAKSNYKMLIQGIKNSELCGTCHTDKYATSMEEAEQKRTHPVNIIPESAKISDDIVKNGGRVGSQGKIICNSCHKIHNAPQDTKILVQKNKASSLCIECHVAKYNQVAETKHDLRVSNPEAKNIKGQTAVQAGVCMVCHLPHRGQGPKIWAREPADDKDPIARLCLSCHNEHGPAEKKLVGPADRTHPYNVVIGKAKGSDGDTTLPLFSPVGVKITDGKSGLVSCGSCHDVHRWDPDSLDKKGIVKEEGTSANSFLRIKNDVGSPLCYDCHINKSYIESTDHDMSMMAYKHPRSHCIQILGEGNEDMLKLPKEVVHKLMGKQEGKTGICGTCHTPHNATFYKLWSRPTGPGTSNDEKLCFSCHYKGNVAEVKQLGEYTHPVGVPITNLGDNINTSLPTFTDDLKKTKNGKVMCFSCHDLHKWDPNLDKKGPGKKVEGDSSNSFLRLAATDSKHALCDSCHIDKKLVRNTDHDMNITAPNVKNIKGETVAQSGICGACHTVHNATYKYRLWNRVLGTGKDGVSELCTSCHADNQPGEKKQSGKHSHPVGKNILGATADLPVPFPTYDDSLHKTTTGRVLCSSCHNLHQWDPAKLAQGPGKNTEGDRLNSFLRAPNTSGYAFCVMCHKGKEVIIGTKHDMGIIAPDEKNYFGQTVAQSGVCGACHVVHQTLHDERLWSRPFGPGQDTISKLCNSCHAKNMVAKKKVISPGTDSHPINANMLAADGSTSFPLFSFEGKRNNDNGRVFCASCHDPHQWDPKKMKPGNGEIVEGDQSNSFLRKSNLPDPELCADCHAQKALVVGTDHDLRITAPTAKNLLGRTTVEDGVCSACHIIHNGPNNIRLWGFPWGPSFIKDWNHNLGIENDRAIQYCTSCHAPGRPGEAKQPPRGLHPYGFVVGQRRAVDIAAKDNYPPLKYFYKTLVNIVNNKDMLLGIRPMFPAYTDEGLMSPNGDLTCPTCHNPHQWNPKKQSPGSGKNEEGTTRNSFLRPNLIYDFCIDCHGYDALYRTKYYHTYRARTKLDPPTKFQEVEMLIKQKQLSTDKKLTQQPNNQQQLNQVIVNDNKEN